MTAPRFRAGLVQMCAGRSVDRNIADAAALIREAAGCGAHYVQTPECTSLMELEPARLLAALQTEADTTALTTFASLAEELGIWLHIGSLAIKTGAGRLANRSYLFAPDGRIAARYDKIHMFDVDLGNGESYKESANYQAGAEAVLASLPWGKLGLTICYDLRFPALFRALAQAGADFIAVPAAFTRITGEAHWHTLLRARAIEAQAFILAAGQGGKHENGRETFGHSLIISPWGEVLADAGPATGVVVADIDPAAVADVRRRIPSLTHDRPFSVAAAVSEAKA